MKTWFKNRRNKNFSNNNSENVESKKVDSSLKHDKNNLTDSQKHELEKEFQANKYLDQNEIVVIAKKFNVEKSVVKDWFKNRRNDNFSTIKSENTVEIQSIKVEGYCMLGCLKITIMSSSS